MAKEVPRTRTGIEGLDSMLGGGIPSGRIVIVSGGPGAGKTTLAIQFLVNGIQRYGENGLYVSLDEPRERIFEYAEYYGWDLEEPYREGKLVMKAKALSAKAKRISVDPLVALTIQYPDPVQRRWAILELFKSLRETGATSIITNEVGSGQNRAVLLEEYLADGVIILRSSQVDRWRVRTIEIEKMRGTMIDEQMRPYIINEKGLSVISEKDIFTFAAGLLMKK
ncbi:MAG: ATPase domain-containing protein [Candidatus Bathyarchaeia archaeon]